jgi:hypothetical protein
MKRLAGGLIALGLPILAGAAGPPPEPSDRQYLDFAVPFSRTSASFDYADGTATDVTLRRVGLTWYERMLPRLELGLFGGLVFLGQADRAAHAGLEPDGYYAGLALRGVLAETSLLQLFVHAQYSYQRLRDDNGQRAVRMSWDQPQAQLGVAIRPGGLLHVYGGAVWTAIEGQERLSSAAATTTTRFDARRRTGGFVGLDLSVEPDGYVGMELRSGTERGGMVYFKKRF